MSEPKPTTRLRKKPEIKEEKEPVMATAKVDQSLAPTMTNTIIDQDDEYLDADQLHKQLASKGEGTDVDVMAKLYQLEQVVRALAIKKGGLDSAKDFVPVTDKRIITHINGGVWPQCRYVIYHNARICMKEDIPYIKEADKLTTVDVNQPDLTGKLKALEAL